MLRRVSAWLVYPLLIGGGMTLGYVLVVRGVSPAIVVGALGAASMLIVALLERVHPYVPDWNRARGDVVPDVLHTLVSSIGAIQLATLGVLVVLAGVAPWIAGTTGVALWPAHWPLLAQLALALAVGELGQYWAHRLLHERAFLWRWHAVHHSAERMYWLNGGRNHPFDATWQAIGLYTPLALVGASADVLTLVALFPAIHTPLQHSNVAAPPGFLSYVFSTNELHRWHHAPGAVGNSNYGGNVVLWDHVFRTFHRPPQPCTEVGLADMPDFPHGYFAHLAAPFRWRSWPAPAEAQGTRTTLP